MVDCCSLILFALIAVGILAVVGHGLWLLLAACFRLLLGPQAAPSRTAAPERDRRECLRCGSPRPVQLRYCPHCRLDSQGVIARELADLEAASRQLKRLRRRQDLSADVLEQAWQIVEQRYQHLIGAAAEDVPAEVLPPLRELPTEVIPPLAAAAPALRQEIPARDIRTEPLPPQPLPREKPDAASPDIPILEAAEPLAAESALPVPAAVPENGKIPAAVQSPQSPRSRWNDWLAGFLEERNILWGELVGGLLIVGGSVALVVSLWNTLQKNPYFPFGILAAIAAALFAAGLYTWKHWKLEATSRGVLVIAALLVPLAFLVLPSMLEKGAGGSSEIFIAGGALLLFIWLLYRAALVLIPDCPWLLPLALPVCCLEQFATARLIHDEQPALATLWLLGLVPVLCQAGSAEWLRHSLKRQDMLTRTQAGSLLALLGLLSFALALALGFLLVRCPEARLALQQITPLLVLAALPLVQSGLLLHERLTSSEEHLNLRVTGTAVAAAGALLALAALALAWPVPLAVLLVCILNVVLFTAVAFRHALPLAHIPALAGLAVGTAVLFLGDLSYTPSVLLQQPQHIFASHIALLLIGLALLLAALAELLVRLGQLPHARIYLCGAGAVGTAALALAGWHGLAEPEIAALTFALYTLGAAALNLRWRRRSLTYLSCGALTATLLWVLYADWLPFLEVWTLALAGEALLFGVLALRFSRRTAAGEVTSERRSAAEIFGRPLLFCALGVAVLAMLLGGWSGWQAPWQPEQVLAAGLLAALFVVLTALHRSTLTAALAGVLLLATILTGTEWLAGQLAAADLPALLALSTALTCLLLALLVLGLHLHSQHRPGDERWYDAFVLGEREIILAAGVLALWYSVRSGTLFDSRWHTLAWISLAVSAWLLVWPCRSRALAWIGSTLFLFGLLQGLALSATLIPAQLLLATLLIHATVQIAAALLLWRGVGSHPAISLLAGPLLRAGLLSTILALPLLFLGSGARAALALEATWLAGLWLAVSWSRRLRSLLTAAQLVLCMAVVQGVKAWLEQQPWIATEAPALYSDPRSLQACGIGLAVLAWLFVLARLVLLRTRTGQILLTAETGISRYLLTLLLLAQVGLADWGILRELAAELAPRELPRLAWLWPATAVHAVGPGAWLLLGVLALVLLTTLWQPAATQRAPATVLGFSWLLLAIPPLLAGLFIQQQASAAALRWGLALTFLAGSLPVWLRGSLARLAARWHIESAQNIPLTPDPSPRSTGARGEEWPLTPDPSPRSTGARGESWLPSPPEYRGQEVGSEGDHCSDRHLPMPGAATLSSRWRLRLLDGLLVPLLLLTGLTAYIGLNLLPAAGPLAGSELVRLPLSLALPLLVAAAALVGHALRERSAGYAYAGGCLVTLAGALWYSVAVVRTGQIFTAAHWVQLLYILVILQAGWAILWLLVRRWLPATTGADGSGQTVPWLLLQLSVPALLLTAVLVAGILALTALPDGSRLHGLVWYPPASPWTLAAGAPLGWLALASLATALFLHQRNRLAPGVPAYLGLALVMLLACSGEIRAPGWGYRTWLLGLAGFTLAWALLPWRLLRRDPDQRFITAAPWWVGVGSLLGILFSVHAALLHNDPLWAASVIASIGVAILGLGLQRSWDAVLFVGSLVLVLSSSLLVGHAQRPLPLAQWWLTLVHVDALVLLLAALLWLVLAQRRSAAVRPWWLGGQLALGVGAVLAPLAAALVLLYRHPEAPPAALLRPLGSWLGLGVFAAAVLAGGWYLARYHGRWWIHFAVAAVVLLAVQAAAVALPWDTGNWLVWHVFTVGLGLNSLLLLLACWWAAALLNAGSHFWSSDSEQRWVRRLQPLLGSRAGLQWLEVLALLPAVLSLRTALSDPLRPYWPVGLLLVSAVLWLCLLLWQRRPFQVHMLGGVLTLPAAVIWLTWGQDMVVPLLTWHVLGLGLAAIATACVEAGRPRMSDADREGPALLSAVLGPLMLPGLAVLVGGFLLLISTPGLAGWRQAPPEILRDGNILLALAIILAVVPLLLVNRRMFVSSFRHRLQEDWTFTRGACVLALHLFALLVLLLTVADGRAELPRWATGLLWPAWGSLGLTALISALDRSKRRLSYDALPLYITGLLGLSLLLYQLQLGPQRWLWSACLLLALYLLLASLVSSWAGRWLTAPVWREQPWFVPVQGIFAVVVLVLSLWLVCAFTHLADRLAGPLAVGLLIAAALVLAVSHTLRHRKPRLRYATLVLGGACLLTLLWALLNPAQAHIHLLRHILWLAAISVATLAYGPGLRQGLSRSSDWVRCGESLSRLCWLAAALSVFAVLVHEMIALGTKTAAPLPPWAIVLVAAAIVGLTASGLRFALVPADDPFALPEKRRTLYVYGAEVFLVLLMMHLRLTVPEVLPGLVSRYWPFLVLLLAFAGVGLAELCQRLRLPVLAGPLQRTGLFLPLLPLLMCWLLLLGVPLPGSAEVPLPKLLAALPRTFAGYALLWLLTSAVYALAALAHRSPRFALLAALAGNLGIWSLLYHHRDAGLGFLSHPQLWLLPLALILLVAEHLNRSRLGPVRSMSLRYFALIVLYLSSTADLFLSGLDDVGMALVLAVLAILGILAGILLRVRAFLFVGFPFLLLVIAARIWHAAVQQAQTWVWWVAVIVLGVLILILFALFEKRRQDVLRVLEEFRDWH